MGEPSGSLNQKFSLEIEEAVVRQIAGFNLFPERGLQHNTQLGISMKG